MATNNAINTGTVLTVSQGGTGDSSVTAYAVLCGGTTSTGAVQSVSGVGSSGQVLTSNGAAALPTWQAASSSGSWNLLLTQTASSSASLSFSSTYVTGYTQYALVLVNINNATGTTTLNMDWSTNNGSTYIGSGYQSGILSNNYNSTTLANTSSTTTCPLTPSITNTNVKINGIIYVFFPASAVTAYNGQLMTNDTTSVAINCYGINSGTTTINNIKFSYSSGNIASGTISLYGLSS
jgi:hypothetical protein